MYDPTSMITSERYTPTELYDRCVNFLRRDGSKVLDPCSSPESMEINKSDFHFTMNEKPPTLARDWFIEDELCNVFINPPSKSKPFYNKLLKENNAGRIGDSLYLAYNVGQLHSTQNGCAIPLLEWQVCHFRQRVKYLTPAKYGILKSGAMVDSALVFIPSKYSGSTVCKDFYLEFKDLGRITTPYRMY